MKTASPWNAICNKVVEFFYPVVGWLPVLGFLFYSINIRIHNKYFSSILIASSRDVATAGTADVLFLYREDLLLFGVLTPLLIALAYRLLRRSLATKLVIVLVFLVCTLLYANLQSWGQVGRFLTASALLDAVAFGLSRPGVIGSYLSLGGFAKFLAVACLASAYFLLLARVAARPRLKLVLGAGGALVVALNLAAAAAGYHAELRGTNISRSFLVNAVKSLLPNSETKNPYAALDDTALRSQFHRLARDGGADPGAANAGSERKSNLLLFVLETGSIEFLDTRKELAGHPLWDLLSKSRYVSGNHYSTFPASAESNLSILAGMYPPRAYYDTCLVERSSHDAIPTLIGQLRGNGVKTAAYIPYPSQVPMDKVVFEATGFEKIYYGQQHLNPQVGGADRIAFYEMMRDLKQWGAARQQFAAGFFPQIGHGPWGPELGGSIAERGHKVVMMQLDWLYELAKQLDADGVLNDTVIVITGDHGVRTTQEDPALKAGMIDRYSLNVPLIVVAPHSRYPAGVSMRPTSHVDIPAELSQLFGLAPQALIQGIPLLDARIDTRRQFFMANWYFGADGYREPGLATMYSSVLDVAFARPDGVLSFQPKDIVVDRATETGTRQVEAQILDVQYEWVRRFACIGKPKG